ncbi:hypothetical protein SDJN03_06955, partial [Cucurbita argyrosperma subsp. sororia]
MVDQDENEFGNLGHTHLGASALLWKEFIYIYIYISIYIYIYIYISRGEEREEVARLEEERAAPRLIDFSQSEEDLSFDDPKQEEVALDVRSAGKERRGIGCPRTAALG